MTLTGSGSDDLIWQKLVEDWRSGEIEHQVRERLAAQGRGPDGAPLETTSAPARRQGSQPRGPRGRQRLIG